MAKTIAIQTRDGVYETKERLVLKTQAQAEAGERRRMNDALKENSAIALRPQTAGRPRKGEPAGPRPGSVRSAPASTGGVISKSTVQRASARLAAEGEVRDQRKYNKSEPILTLPQSEAVISLIYDEWMQHHSVDYAKVRDFTQRVQCDPVICRVLGEEPVAIEDAYRIADQTISSLLKKHRIGSRRTSKMAASRSRTTMAAEEALVDENTRRFPAWSLVVLDESCFMWGETLLRTLAASTGLGTHVAVADKHQNVRSTLVLAVRLTDEPEKQLFQPVIIPGHDSMAATRDCLQACLCP